MKICPHVRRADLPCPYPGCHAALEGTEDHAVAWLPDGEYVVTRLCGDRFIWFPTNPRVKPCPAP